MAVRAPGKLAQDPLVVFEVPNFNAGLHYDAPPVSIPDNSVQDSLNVIFDNGTISKRTGYGPPLNSLGQPVRLMDEWTDKNGNQWLMAVTDKDFWTFSPNSGTWQNLTPGGAGTLTGSLSLPVTGVGFYGKYFVTNDSDKPFYWDGVAATGTFLTTTGAPLRATSVAAFFNHLLWLNVNDPALGFQPQQVTWSDNQNGLVYNSGDAGIAQLEDTNDMITTCEIIYSYLAIARNQSIYVCEYIGYPFFYAFFRRVEKDGIVAANSFKKNQQFIMGMSQENIIGFDGSQEQPFVGEPISSDLYGGIIDPRAYYDLMGSTKAIYDIPNQKYRLWVSHLANGEPNIEYAYSTKFQNWSKHTYADIITSAVNIRAQVFTRWNDPIPTTTPWKNRIVRWNSPDQSGIGPQIYYGDINGNIYNQTGTYYGDNGKPINAFFTTKAYEFHHPDWIKELQRIQFIFKGQSSGTLTIAVFTSDDGYNYTQAKSSPLILQMNGNPIQFVDCFATGQWFYITVSNNTATDYFEIWRVRFAYEPLYRRAVA